MLFSILLCKLKQSCVISFELRKVIEKGESMKINGITFLISKCIICCTIMLTLRLVSCRSQSRLILTYPRMLPLIAPDRSEHY